MKRIIIIPAIVIATLFTACKAKPKDPAATDQKTETPATTAETANPQAAQPTSYTVSFVPDTVYLGKNKEAFVKLSNPKATQTSDPDGKVTGIEFTYEIELTNKNKIGAGSIFINPSDFRLQLDNGNNITHENYNSVSADAESTKTSGANVFKIPAGAKPKSLSLFYDDTRVTVAIALK